MQMKDLIIFHTFRHLLDEADAKLLASATEGLVGEGAEPASSTVATEPAEAITSPSHSVRKLAEKAEPSEEEMLARLFV
jgi:hypothetical protein